MRFVNRAAIISLNAEISMTKVRNRHQSLLNPAETMEKIIEQCLKISKILDSVEVLKPWSEQTLSCLLDGNYRPGHISDKIRGPRYLGTH